MIYIHSVLSRKSQKGRNVIDSKEQISCTKLQIWDLLIKYMQISWSPISVTELLTHRYAPQRPTYIGSMHINKIMKEPQKHIIRPNNTRKNTGLATYRLSHPGGTGGQAPAQPGPKSKDFLGAKQKNELFALNRTKKRT